MFELTINNEVYQFHFGMGFLREVNKKLSKPIDGVKDGKQNIGLQYTVAGIIDGDLETLVDVLDTANKDQKPRITRAALDAYIEDENTDIDALFEDVLGFLKNANATKKVTENLIAAVEAEKAKAAKA